MDDDFEPDRRQYLEIYLQDHRAGAEAGVRLAARCRDHAPDPDKAELTRLAAEIDDDRRALATIMAGLDIEPSTVKKYAGLAAERLGRLKLNGRAVRPSPLSVLVELEGLVGAVSMKRELWITLRAVAETADRDPQLEALVARADDQRSRLEAVHERMARRLFAGSDEASRSAVDGAAGPNGHDEHPA